MQDPIEIVPRRKDLLALYAEHRMIDPLRSPMLRPYHRIFLWGLLMAGALLAASFLRDGLSWLVVLATIVVIGATGMLFYATVHVLKGRLSVLRWARETEEAGPGRVWLGDEGITIEYGGKEYITRWSAVSRAQIHKDHLVMHLDHERMFVKASMTPEAYDLLCAMVREKVMA